MKEASVLFRQGNKPAAAALWIKILQQLDGATSQTADAKRVYGSLY